jgi:hypothetical protein
MAEHDVDPDRLAFDRRVRQMAGVLGVTDGEPQPGDVVLRTVAGHGDRIRRAALAIAPAGVAVRVLEDDLVTAVPAVRPEIAPSPAQLVACERARREAAAPGRTAGSAPGEALRCDYAFCHHRTSSGELGAAAGDPCRRKVRSAEGWLPCPGRYGPAPAPRRRWWGGMR